MRFISFWRLALIATLLLAGCAGGQMKEVVVEGQFPVFSVEEMGHKAHAAVTVVVDEKSRPFRKVVSTPSKPQDWVFTDYTVRVTDAWFGPYQVGDRLKVRIPGGTTEGLSLRFSDGEMDLKTGQQLAIFLNDETEDGAVYLFTGPQGLFDIQGSTAENRVKSKMTLALAELKDRSSKAHKKP